MDKESKLWTDVNREFSGGPINWTKRFHEIEELYKHDKLNTLAMDVDELMCLTKFVRRSLRTDQ